MIVSRTMALLTIAATAAAADTTVHVTGLHSKTENQVLGLVGGRLEHVYREPASSSRADDAAFLVKQMLQKDGYASATVDWRVANGRLIVLTVHEGPRWSLGKVTVNGVPGDLAPKLAKIYARPAEKDRPIASGSPPFREEDVEIGLSYVRQELNARGYWDAEVTMRSRDIEPGTGEVNPIIDVKMGALFKIGQANITSPDGRGIGETAEVIKPFIGLDATTGNINLMRAGVDAWFASNGYPNAKITMGRVTEGGRFVPQLNVDLGKRVILHDVRIEGLEKTNPDRVRVRMGSMVGEWYDEAAMNKRVRGFLATGAFSSVRVELDDVDENSVDARLIMEEGRAKEFSVGVGADSYQGPLLRTTYADRNLFGQLFGFTSGFEFSARGVLGETKLTDPWMFGSDIAGSLRLYALVYGHEGYSTLETGLEGKATWKFNDHYSLEFLLGTALVNATSDGMPVEALGENSYTLNRFRVTQTIDFRDSPVLPKKGWHLEFPFEIGEAIGETSVSYARSGLSGGWYHKINDNYEIGAGGEWGIVVSSDDDASLPIDLRLFNGGSRSVRSFPERELGPSIDGYPTGGETMWNANFEVVRNLTGSLKAVGFIDAGSLSTESTFGGGDVEVAAGLGIRFELPIGPVRLEYGHNLTRDGDEPMGALHFAIGVAF